MSDVYLNNSYVMNLQPVCRSINVGNEKQKILIIDNLMLNPESLVDFAEENASFHLFKRVGNFYPGERLAPPKGYFDSLMQFVRPLLHEEYDIAIGSKMTKAECAISLLTMQPEELTKMQSLPHFDSSNPNQFALLHYICDEKHGGTAFYRHNLTGFETVTRERFDTYTTAFVADIEQNGPPKQEYISDTNERFTKMSTIDLKFNRLIVYRSCLLHSACIDPEISVDSDPRSGRLTVNSFVAFE